jgi:hypothetical protein
LFRFKNKEAQKQIIIGIVYWFIASQGQNIASPEPCGFYACIQTDGLCIEGLNQKKRGMNFYMKFIPG